ncbi:MAG: hypothetical protein ACOC32_04120 [Nanoarchaeota archaeon]
MDTEVSDILKHQNQDERDIIKAGLEFFKEMRGLDPERIEEEVREEMMLFDREDKEV